MKHLKSFETINRDEIIDKFINNYKTYTGYRWWTDEIKQKIERYNFPEEFKEEFSILYFLYTNTNWKYHDRKPENNRIKRVMKKYISDSVLDKLNNDMELYPKLMKMYEKRNVGSIQDINVRHIYIVFDTISSKYDDIISKYNL